MSSKEELRIELQGKMIVLNVWQTCLNCAHWQRGPGAQDYVCGFYNQMPPPEIIVSGCKEYDLTIPF